MCANVGLLTRIRRAKRDVVCYKVLKRKGGRYFSPCHVPVGGEFEWRVGEEMDCGVKIRKVFTDGFVLDFVVNEGFHSMCDEVSAMEFVKGTYFVIAKCHIPKGARYIRGKTGKIFSNYDCYVSERLVVDEIIG